MQRQDDRPPKGGRPSLLSSEQQAEAERQRILSTLDSKPAAAAPAKAAGKPPGKRSGLLVWGAAGAGVLAIVGGTLVWMSNTPDEDSLPPAVAATPAPQPAPAAATPASTESEVSTAAILEDATSANSAAEGKLPSLKEMLTAPAKPASGSDELKQALERPQAKSQQVAKVEHKPEHKTDRKAERKAEHKPERKADNARLAQKAPAKEKEKGKLPDNDVTLITALMAHLQTRPPVKKTSTPAEQLKTCKQYNAAGEEQCRARLCAADAKKEPECKAAPAAKTASNS
ncbi:hypothetical protein GTP81_16620 [Rugamonas sp. FT107W]|uniref:Uncharacterized protein n=1 Tax=Duganella vulcania TaxID=2692166 RepID=A0A845HPK4_9BURK|nr:hypothetical protein [Duganella vulcania]MYN18376.1 hypothetical protein [Duganella vulcania]